MSDVVVEKWSPSSTVGYTCTLCTYNMQLHKCMRDNMPLSIVVSWSHIVILITTIAIHRSIVEVYYKLTVVCQEMEQRKMVYTAKNETVYAI